MPIGTALDVAEGSVGPSGPNSFRFADVAGVPSVSINGGPFSPIDRGDRAPAPGAPSIWYDAQNVDGLYNASLTDGQLLGTWNNLGSLASANVVQAVSANRPTFRAIAITGKLKNRSAVEGGVGKGMASGAISLASPMTYYAVVRAKSSQAGGGFFIDGSVARQQWGAISLQQRLFATGGAPVTGQSLVLNAWHLIAAQFNGATSFTREDGAQSANVDPGTSSIDMINLMSAAGVTNSFDGYLAELIGYQSLAATPAFAALESYFWQKYGVTSQP